MYLKLWGLSTWTNQDDRINMTEIGEHDQKIDNDKCYLLNITENINIFGQIHINFGQVQSFTFVGVSFRSRSNVKVHRCQIFRVKFWPIFSHIDLVQWTSLKTLYLFLITNVFCWRLLMCPAVVAEWSNAVQQIPVAISPWDMCFSPCFLDDFTMFCSLDKSLLVQGISKSCMWEYE